MSWTPPEFADREEERACRGQTSSRRSAALLVRPGRRRVGKTTLLERFARKARVPVLDHVAAQTTVKEESARLSVMLSEFFKDRLPEMQLFEAWPCVLEHLGQKARERPPGWVLEEMPHAVEGERSVPGHLQAAGDAMLRRTGIKIVLRGSSIGMMEEIGIIPTSPLFGRRTGQWKLEPPSPEALAQLWPRETLARALGVDGRLGGRPLYPTKFDPGRSVLEDIREQNLAKGRVPVRRGPLPRPRKERIAKA